MGQFMEFTSRDGAILLEVDAGDVQATPGGLVKAGLQDRVNSAVAVARDSLEESVVRVLRSNARTFLRAVEELDRKPAEMEVTFGLKATGEVGNMAVAKAAGEASYSVRLLWRG